MPSNKLLQLSLMDSADVSRARNPAAVNGAAEPGRWGALRFFEEAFGRMWFDSFDSLVTQQFSSTTK